MTTIAIESASYASLKALEDASDTLIKSLPEEELSVSDSELNAISDRIAQFIDRATMTGTVLDSPGDRRAAQALVDFWLAKFYAIPSETRSGQRPSTRTNALLKPFDSAAVKVMAAAGDKVLSALREKDDAASKSVVRRGLSRVAPWLGHDATSYKDLARRMLLRTVRMSDDEGTCEPVAVKRDELLSLGEANRTKEVLDSLVASGVFRVEPNESGDLISLGYEALTREWGALGALIAERVDFRRAAVYWDQRARADRALTSGRQANKALADYADLNAQERAFIAANSSYTQRMISAGAIACVLALPVVWIASKSLYYFWEANQAQKAIQTIISGGDKRSTEEAIQRLARFGRSIQVQSQPLQDLDLKGMYDRNKPPPVADFVKSAIVRVKFENATLRYASFSQCKIEDAEFPGAELSSARFDEAVIIKSKFSGAILYRAIFDHAQFNGPNDFSNADLQSASFRNIAIDGEFNLAGTAWWLAFGWTLPQIDEFTVKYREPPIETTKIFDEDIKSRQKEVDNAASPEDRMRALNQFAWTYATYGADREKAGKLAQRALTEFNAIKTVKDKTWIAKNRLNIADTMAYIALQGDKPARAVELLEQAGIEPTSDGGSMFRYAFALHALALKENGDKKKLLEEKALAYLEKSLKNRNYVPSHELYLLRSYIADEFQAKLAAWTR